MILDKIVDYKRTRVEKDRKAVPLKMLKNKIEKMPPCRDFEAALKGSGVSIIAEIKKASPSRGVMREDFDPEKIAAEYEEAGVDVVSVITEDKFFLGSDGYLKAARKKLSVPVLRKDFVIDEYQLYQARAIGADAVLLIASILTGDELRRLYGIACAIGLSCLVEAHTEEEVKKAVSCGARIIGINNRDLKTFNTDIANTGELVRFIPDGAVVVSESGIHSGEDIRALSEMGVDAVLVGQSIMESSSIAGKIMELRGGLNGDG